MDNSKNISTLNWVIIAVVVVAAGLALYFGPSLFKKPSSPPTASPTPAPARAASFYLEPASGSYSVNEQFTLDVRVDTQDSAVAALSAFLLFDSEKLEVVSLDSADSPFSIEAEQKTEGNIIKITRGEPKPWVSGNNILVAKVNFKAKTSGQTAVDFSLVAPGEGPSRVILADGLGTDILQGAVGGSYTVR